MSLYSEFLRMAVNGHSYETDVRELVALAARRRAGLDDAGDATERLARALEYDVVLVQLCDAVGVEHRLFDGGPELIARLDAEVRLADRLPALSEIFVPDHKGQQP